MKIHGHPSSPSTRRVLATLAEKGHEAELVLVDLARGEARTPEHLALSPFGLLPVLEDEGFSLHEARAICRYLDEKLPGPSLAPASLQGRALMEQFISIEQSHFAGPAATIRHARLTAQAIPSKPANAALREALGALVGPLDLLDRALEKQDYLAGTFSLADIAYMPTLDDLFAAGQGSLITSRHHLAAWWGHLSERASWQKVRSLKGSG